MYYHSGTYYPWYDLRDSVKHVVFEDGITALSSYLFEYMNNIETVTLTEEEKQEYIPMYVDGVLYGNDNGGVDFIDYEVDGDTVTFTDLDHNPLVVLTRVSGNQYRVSSHLNQSHYLYKSLPIGTLFTFVEE